MRPDTRNIDKIALMKALCDYIHTNNLEHLDEEHMKVLLACITKPVLTSELESWLKIFKNIKDYLFVALLDPELVLSALTILNKFFTINNITETVFDVRRFFAFFKFGIGKRGNLGENACAAV